jgi:signal transduction histidine kinase
MGGPQARADLSAALGAEARTLGAALILLAVPGDGRWWILAASAPLLSAHPDPVELWDASAGGADAGRAPAVVCEVLGRRPAQRWVSDAAPSPELRLAVYWTAAARVPVQELVAVRRRLVAAASTPVPPAWQDAQPDLLAQIVEDLPLGLVFFDCAGVSVAANRSARRLLGLRAVDMSPRTVARRLEEIGVRKPLGAASPPGPAEAPLQVNGRQYAVSAQPAHGAWGRGIVWRIEDVTQARLAEAKLDEAKRALLLAEVSGGIGHEFNNLLSRVMGLAEDIQDESGPGAVHSLAETVIETAERGAQVVRRLMTYAGSVPPDVQLVDLKMLATFWRTEQPADDLVFDTADCTAEVLVDPALLKACLEELLKNARQAGASEIRIDCRPEAAGQMTALVVADDGAGMDATTLARATEPFFTTRAVGEGVGLGLSMVKGALDQWGGRLRLVSELGKGTTVTLLLPTPGAASAADL